MGPAGRVSPVQPLSDARNHQTPSFFLACLAAPKSVQCLAGGAQNRVRSHLPLALAPPCPALAPRACSLKRQFGRTSSRLLYLAYFLPTSMLAAWLALAAAATAVAALIVSVSGAPGGACAPSDALQPLPAPHPAASLTLPAPHAAGGPRGPRSGEHGLPGRGRPAGGRRHAAPARHRVRPDPGVGPGGNLRGHQRRVRCASVGQPRRRGHHGGPLRAVRYQGGGGKRGAGLPQSARAEGPAV